MAEVGVAYIDIEARIDSFQKQVTGQIQGMESSFKRSFGNIAKMAVTAFAAFGGFQLGKDAIKEASNLEQSLSKVRAVLGPAAGEMEKFSKSAAKNLGMAQSEALAAAGGFANMFTQIGLSSGASGDMSKQMLTLAADLGAFHDANPTEVIESLGAAFRGEYDSVQRYIPMINAATVEQKALEMGLAGSKKELDAQDKAIATHALLTEGAGKADGAWAREMGNASSQQQTMTAQIKEAKAALGGLLMPAVAAFLRLLTEKLIPALTEWGERVGPKVSAFLRELGGFLSGVLPVLGDVALTLWNLAKNHLPELAVALGAIVAIKMVLWIKSVITSLTALAANPVVLIILGIAALVAGLIYAYRHFEGFRNVVDKIGRWLADTLFPALQVAAQWFADTWAKLWPYIVAGWETIRRVVAEVVWPILQTIFQAIGTIFTTVLIPAFRVLWEVAQVVWNGISTVIQVVWAILQPIFNVLAAIFTTVIVPAFQLFWTVAQVVFNGLRAVVEGAWAIIGPILEFFWNIIAGPIKAALETLYHVAVVLVFQPLGKAIREVWEKILRPTFEAVAGFITDNVIPPFRNLWNFINDKVVPIFTTMKDKASEAFNGIIDAVKNVLGKIGEKIREALNAGIYILNKFLDPVGSMAEMLTNGGVKKSQFHINEIEARHEGGIVGDGRGSRRGAPGARERLVLAQDGEGVIPVQAMRKMAPAAFEAMRTGDVDFQALSKFTPKSLNAWFTHGDPTPMMDLWNPIETAKKIGTAIKEGGEAALGFARDFIASTVRPAIQIAVNSAAGLIDNFGTPGELAAGAIRRLADMSLDFISGTENEIVAELAKRGPGEWPMNDRWPPTTSGGLARNAQAAKDWIVKHWGWRPGDVGGWRATGSVATSDHPRGKALDVMMPISRGHPMGYVIRDWFKEHPEAFGLKYWIWMDQIGSSPGFGARPYSHPAGNNDNLQHRNHVHLSFLENGGLTTQAGLAMVHPGEAHLPLNNPMTTDALAEAFAKAGGGIRIEQMTVVAENPNDWARQLRELAISGAA